MTGDVNFIFGATYLGHWATLMALHNGPAYHGYPWNTTRGIAPLVRIWAHAKAAGRNFPGYVNAYRLHGSLVNPTRWLCRLHLMFRVRGVRFYGLFADHQFIDRVQVGS